MTPQIVERIYRRTDIDPQVVELSLRLAEAAARNTATSVSSRIMAAKTAKKDQQAIAELEEIVSELIDDRSELLQIAQAYKEEVASQRLSQDDVEYITQKFMPKLTELVEMTSADDGDDARQLSDALTPLLSVETMTILQLVGFNFRRALGEPLTALVASAIESRTRGSEATPELQLLNARREIALIELALDEDAYRRFTMMIGG